MQDIPKDLKYYYINDHNLVAPMFKNFTQKISLAQNRCFEN